MANKQLSTDELTFKPVTTAEWADLQTLFADTGPQNGCWCMYWRVKRAEFHANFGEPNKQALRKILEAGNVPGILAYLHERPVGWCAIAPRSEFPALDRSPTLKRVDNQPVWSIVCFFVARPYRRQGVTQALIEAAIAYARDREAEIIEAYPLISASTRYPYYELYMGAVSVFEKIGFREVARRSSRRAILRYDVYTHVEEEYTSIQYIIFDLSEVLIHGLVQFKEDIAREIGVTAQTSAAAFGGPHLRALLEGSITEDRYLDDVIEKNAWAIAPDRLKRLIRRNFDVTLPGTIEIARQLSHSYRLALLSDHAREWASYIVATHEFLDGLFVCKLFSYEIGSTKREPRIFHILLTMLSAVPGQCLFIDDSARNVEVARSVGIDSIRFLDAEQLRGELVERGIVVEHGH